MLTLVPPDDCMRAREAVSTRLDGELPELDSVRLEAHLAGCDECRTFAAGTATVAAELRAAALEPVPGVMFEPQPRRQHRVGAGSLAAAVVLVAAAVGPTFFLGKLLGPAGHSAPQTATLGSISPVRALHGLDPSVVALLGDRLDRGRLIAI